jgi:hypothetical protein
MEEVVTTYRITAPTGPDPLWNVVKEYVGRIVQAKDILPDLSRDPTYCIVLPYGLDFRRAWLVPVLVPETA